MNPPHPRIAMEREILNGAGHEATVYHASRRKPKGLLSRLLYYLTLSFFRWDLVSEFRRRAPECSTALIYDLALLPLAKHFHQKGIRVIYETIDDNSELIPYSLATQYPFLRPILPWVKRRLKKWENAQVEKYCDAFLINSDNLRYIHPRKAVVNYYASPFENVNLEMPTEASPAFLYLGIISEEKGFDAMLGFWGKYNIPFYLFGNFAPANLQERIRHKPGIHHVPRLASGELREQLLLLAGQHRLLGFSLIKSVNESYAFQEANKDIDYMALGIPFIGNRRGSTKEKIEAGCGVFDDDPEAITRLLDDPAFYENIRTSARLLYDQKYAAVHFAEILRRVVEGN